MHVLRRAAIPASFGEAAAYLGPEVLEAQRQASREVKEQVRETFEQVCGTGRNVVWREAEGDAGRLLAGAAHCADLVVMGAYGHGRLRELVFGGATRHVLGEANLPVLFGS